MTPGLISGTARKGFEMVHVNRRGRAVLSALTLLLPLLGASIATAMPVGACIPITIGPTAPPAPPICPEPPSPPQVTTKVAEGEVSSGTPVSVRVTCPDVEGYYHSYDTTFQASLWVRATFEWDNGNPAAVNVQPFAVLATIYDPGNAARNICGPLTLTNTVSFNNIDSSAQGQGMNTGPAAYCPNTVGNTSDNDYFEGCNAAGENIPYTSEYGWGTAAAYARVDGNSDIYGSWSALTADLDLNQLVNSAQ